MDELTDVLYWLLGGQTNLWCLSELALLLFPLFMVFKVFISVMCGVYGEKVFKGLIVPFPVQVANILMISVPFAGIALYPMGLTAQVTKPSLDIYKYGWFDLHTTDVSIV